MWRIYFLHTFPIMRNSISFFVTYTVFILLFKFLLFLSNFKILCCNSSFLNIWLSCSFRFIIFIPFLPSLIYFCFLSITFTFFIRLKVNHDGYSYPAGVAICYLTDYLFRFIILDVVSNDNAVAIFKKTIKWVCIVMKVIILGGIWLTVPPILIGTYTLVNITFDSMFFMKYLESATIAINFAISMKLM